MCRKTWLMPLASSSPLCSQERRAPRRRRPSTRRRRRRGTSIQVPRVGSGARARRACACPWCSVPRSPTRCPPQAVKDNSGYLDTSLGSLLGVGATSIGTFTGPEFTYDGVKGEEPDVLEVDLVRKADVEALLSVAGNSATFSVKLVDTQRRRERDCDPGQQLAGATSFTRVPSAEIDPSDLRSDTPTGSRSARGSRSGTTVLPGGMAGYDNVVLKARTTKRRGGHGGTRP